MEKIDKLIKKVDKYTKKSVKKLNQKFLGNKSRNFGFLP